jgi:nucleotide-binding universal stress UspA family protein
VQTIEELHFYRLLVAIDGSRNAEVALAAAITASGYDNSRITLISVAPRVMASIGLTMAASPEKLQEELDERAQQTLRDAAARVPHHIPVTTLFRRGRAGAEIVAEANTGNHDAVFVGARGVGRVAALIGSVSQYVVRHAEVFVIVVHAPSTDDD